MIDIIKLISNRLDELNKRPAYLADLAQQRGICSRMMVYNFLNSKNRIPWETACKLADLLDIKIDAK
jgi:hypothetical protein